jgi:conjugal transfer pilus assembly protein TraI
MFARILKFFQSTPPPPRLAIEPTSSQGRGLEVFNGDEPGDFAISKYPPFDRGIPVIDVAKVLHTQTELIDRIFRTVGVSREDLSRHYSPIIESLARHAHLLPATSTTFFRGTGGLFRMSLEIALNSVQSANASVFPTGGVERRFYMQPKWILATFIAGLCCQNYRTVNTMAVMTRDSQQWSPLLEKLYDWCKRIHTDVYFVRWMDSDNIQGAQASSTFLISQIVPKEVLDYLASDNNQVMPAMTAAVAGVETNMFENPIGRLIAPVTTKVIEEDLKRSATNYGHLIIGVHIEPHLVSAMRRLILEGKWSANNFSAGGQLWIGREGVFLHWSQAARDIADLLMRDKFSGVPTDPDSMADLLVSARLLQNAKQGERYWTIIIPMTGEVLDGCVKLREGNVIFPRGFDFTPFEQIKLTQTQAKPSRKSSPEPPPEPDLFYVPEDYGPPKEMPEANEAHEPAQPIPPSNHNSEKPHPEEKPRPEEIRGQEEKPQPKPESAPAKKPRKSAKSAETKAETEHEPSDTALLSTLQAGNAWLLGKVIEAAKTAKEGSTVSLHQGLGLTHEALNAHGQPAIELLEEMAMKGWLWQDKTRPSRKIHSLDLDGKTMRVVILKPEVAKGLGFTH